MDVENYAIYAVDCVVIGKRLQSETRTRTKKTETGQSFKRRGLPETTKTKDVTGL